MKKIGDLPFEFTDGSCNSFQTLLPVLPGEQIYLCFSSNQDQTVFTEFGCYFTEALYFTDIKKYFVSWEFVQSIYSHKNTLGLGNYRGKPFVTGCDRSPDCSTKTEIIRLDEDWVAEWNPDVAEYPFVSDSR